MRSVICVAVVLWSLTAHAGSMVDGLSVTEFFAKFERSAIKLNDSGMQLTQIRRQHSSSRSGLYGPTRSRWYSSAQTALCVRARNEPRWPLMMQTKRRPRDMGTRKRCDDVTTPHFVGGDRASAFRCGALTGSGRLAIAPMYSPFTALLIRN
jgi:hypothetical protein